MAPETAGKALRLSVKSLVDFSARRGDLFHDQVGPSHLEGLAVHARVQAERSSEWQKEYPFKQQLEVDGYCVTLQGRADLVNESGQQVVIEEIKSTYIAAKEIAENKKDLFWAQVKVYGFLHSLANPGRESRYELRLTLANVHSRQVDTEARQATAAELEQFTMQLVAVYLQWHDGVAQRRAAFSEGAEAFGFPHSEFRAGQHALARAVYKTIRDKGKLLAQAPTGTGKTVSTLFPTIKALGRGLAGQAVYLTAKTSGQRQAESCMQMIQSEGLQADYLVLTARDKICPCRNGETEPSTLVDEAGNCQYTIGFYDRLPEARVECLQHTALSADTLAQIALRHQLCPFALAQHLLPWSTVVICDYNYYFHPLSRSPAFTDHTDCVLLVDEAHNLPARARDMISGCLTTQGLGELASVLGAADPAAKTLLRRLQKSMLEWAVTLGPVAPELPPALPHMLNELAERLQAARVRGGDLFGGDAMTSASAERDLYQFLAALAYFGDYHKLLLNSSGSGKRTEAEITLFCMDASKFLRQCMKPAKAVIAFSATLSPMPFYSRMIGAPDAETLVLPSPFPADNQLVLRCDYIDTRWAQRADSVASLCQLLAEVYRQKPGKYLTFFPSYEYMQAVHTAFCSTHPEVNTCLQRAGGKPEEQTIFLAAFFDSDQPMLGFAILGGVFAEGVDFYGDALHGAIIIGTGMPQPSTQQKLIEGHFGTLGLNAHQYAYQFPGLTRVQQSGGRVVRAATDRGVIILVDPRFRRADYARLLAPQWKPRGCDSADSVAGYLKEFWQKRNIGE